MAPSVLVLPATRVGQVPRLVSRARATAERRQRDQALRHSEALKTSILASLACGMVAADPHGVITTSNACAEAILGYRADELTGKLTPELFRDNARGRRADRKAGRAARFDRARRP